MYRINTGEARTDLYQTGERANQVFDPSIAIHFMDRDAAARERKEAAKAKKEQENDDDIEMQLKSMGGKAIMSHDAPLVAQKTQAVIDYTKKNIDKLRAGDMNARMEFDKVMGDLQTTTALSVDKRQKWEATGQWMAQNSDKVREDAKKAHFDYAGSSHAGDFSYSPAQYMKENIDLNEDFKTNVRPQIEDMALKGTADYIDPTTGIKTTNKTNSLTDDQVKDVLKDRLADHNIYDQASYDLSKEPEEKQKKYGSNVNQYYIDKMLPYGRINRNERTQTLGQDKSWDSSHVINATYQPSKDGKVFSINANSQKPTTLDLNGKKQTIMLGEVRQDKDGKIVGEVTVQLTPEQKQENDAVRHEAYEKDFNEYKNKIISLTDVSEIAAIPKPIKDDAKYRKIKVPNPDTKKLNYTETSKILKNVYGIDNIYETFNKDETPASHVDMKTTDTRNKSEKPAFTKQELEDKAAQAGYSYKDYYNLVKDKVTLK